MRIFSKALQFAARKHAGQMRNNGDTYIIHPIRVAQEVKTAEQKVIALLHDVLEDTDTTFSELEELFGTPIADAVEALTHREGESYVDYIERVKQNPDAVQVKIADICDNLSDAPSANAIRKSAIAITALIHTLS